MNLSGNRIFYYYDNIEIGDTTFFTKTDQKGIDSMCDLGFGLERLRWVLDTNKSYYDLYSDSKDLNPREKALISAISLLAVCEIAPSQKNCGYRVRLFSKKLAETLNTRKLSINELNYFKECIEYWNDWMKSKKSIDFSPIEKEYERNCNSIVLNSLIQEGYKVSRINVNVSWEEMEKRLYSGGVPKERVKQLKR